MKCGCCNTSIDSDSSFCPKCGEDLSLTEKEIFKNNLLKKPDFVRVAAKELVGGRLNDNWEPWMRKILLECLVEIDD